MSLSNIQKIKQFKKYMTTEQKRKLIVGLKKLKEIGGETDITNPDNLVSEDEFTAATKPDRNVVAKTFDTNGDFDSYVNQRRGIEMTPKEQQAIDGYDRAKPTQKDKFFIKFENTDEFGNNDTTVIKKLKEGSQFCWTAFSKYENAKGKNNTEDDEGENKDEESSDKLPDLEDLKEQSPPSNQLSNSENNPENNEITVDDPIRITKSITFIDDTQGADILSDFMEKLDI